MAKINRKVINREITNDKQNHLDPKINKMYLDTNLKKEDMSYKYGWIAKIFGSNERNVPFYIVAISSIIILMISAVYTFICVAWPPKEFGAKDLWAVVIPVLSSMYGYIFGVGTSKKDSESE